MKCLAYATVLLAAGFAVAACGQKGPLVLPDAQPKHKHTLPPLSSPVKPQSPAAAPAPASAPDTPDQPASAPTPPLPSVNGAGAGALTSPR